MPYRYPTTQEHIKMLLEKEGLTDNIMHDLWLCILEDFEYDIPSRARNKLDARYLHFRTELYFIIFQKLILKRAMKELNEVDTK